MKKLYLQFILVLVSLQTAFAQVIWHPNLGTGPSGDILLGWNSSRYVIHTEDGDEFSSGDAVESMNQQLADLGIRWVHVPYIDNPATGCYEITLELDANTTNSERSIAFGNLLVRQSGENFYPAVGQPTIVTTFAQVSLLKYSCMIPYLMKITMYGERTRTTSTRKSIFLPVRVEIIPITCLLWEPTDSIFRTQILQLNIMKPLIMSMMLARKYFR